MPRQQFRSIKVVSTRSVFRASWTSGSTSHLVLLKITDGGNAREDCDAVADDSTVGDRHSNDARHFCSFSPTWCIESLFSSQT